MNGDRYLLDIDLLLYAYDKFDRAKRGQAKQWLGLLWSNADCAVSWQVLQEFYSNAVRKFSVPPGAARNLVRYMSQWRPPDVAIALIERVWHWRDQAQVTFWDGMIVAAAESHARPV